MFSWRALTLARWFEDGLASQLTLCHFHFVSAHQIPKSNPSQRKRIGGERAGGGEEMRLYF